MKAWLTISQFAKREGVVRNTVLGWIDVGRVDTWEPADGVKLIRSKTKRPDPWKPWEKERRKRISREEM